MPGTQSLIGGGQFAGLTLKAFAFFKGQTGVIQKSLGVTSVTRSGTGAFVVTLDTPLANLNAIIQVGSGGNGTGPSAWAGTVSSSTTINLSTYNQTGGAAQDWTGTYIAIFE